jgi:hypothetical protein
MTEEIKIINADEAEQIDPELPDAGWERDEQLKRRQDQLDQAAEEAGEQREVHAFDPSKLEPDAEILRYGDELEVIDAQPGFKYMWCYEGHNGREIVKKQRLGWIVVQSDMPECSSMKDARGYRRIGDTVLMRIPEERYFELEKAEEYKRLVRKEGVAGALRELGAKYRDKGIIVHDDASNVHISGNRNLMDVMQGKAKQEGTRRTAMKGVDKMLRQGTVPGMPSPGKGGG